MAHNVCSQVVPHLGGVLMTMSRSRNGSPSYRALSYTGCRYPMSSLIGFASQE